MADLKNKTAEEIEAKSSQQSKVDEHCCHEKHDASQKHSHKTTVNCSCHAHHQNEDDKTCCSHSHEHEQTKCSCDEHHLEHDHHEHVHHEDHCCCGNHNHEKKLEDATCCCDHHSHDKEACSCGGHHHEHDREACSCGGHHHEHEDHDGHCCCGHDHEHVENSMDTEWDVSEVHPSQYKLLFSTLGAIGGIKDVGLNPDGLTIIHTPEALSSIENAFLANGLKLKRVVQKNKQTSQIRIPQMDCPTEEGLIRQKLKSIKGVSGLQFNLMNRILTVSYLPGQLPEILAAIKSLDYDPEILEGQQTSLAEFKKTEIPWWKYILGLVLAAGSEAAEFMDLNEYISMVLAIAAILIVGIGTYKKGFIAIKNFNFNMNALMAVAVTGAVLIGSWPEAAMVMVLFEISEAIEQLSLDKARGAIRSLLALAPEKAKIKKDNDWVETKAEDIQVGDVIRVSPGDRLAVDGTIISGTSSINQSAITGESLPVDKKAGDDVFAGTLNENGEFIYEATSTAGNSMPARIISAIESAQSSRAPTQRFVDSFAKVYTPLVFLLALATAIIPPVLLGGDWYDWIYKGLTLLVIACPCALVISTPVTIVTGLANAAKRGILIKGGIYLEKGRKLQRIAFDKTGTITEGKPKVMEWQVVTDQNPAEVLVIAASLVDRNSHPVSKAVTAKATDEGVGKSHLKSVNGFYTVPGQGIIGSLDDTEYYLGNIKGLDKYFLQNQEVRDRFAALSDKGYSPLVLASEKRILAYFGVADSVKTHSKAAIENLNRQGITTVLLSGDNAKTAEKVGSEVGVKISKGNLLPEEKQNLINQFAKKEVTGMVGDGTKPW